MMNTRQCCLVVVVAAVLTSATGVAARAWEPADPDLIPEACRLMEYLLEGRNGRIVSGCQRSGPGSGPFEAWQHASGREPALKGFSIAGFHPKGSDTYHNVLKHTVSDAKFWWTDPQTPEHTTALWRQMFHYLVKERGIHKPSAGLERRSHLAGSGPGRTQRVSASRRR